MAVDMAIGVPFRIATGLRMTDAGVPVRRRLGVGCSPMPGVLRFRFPARLNGDPVDFFGLTLEHGDAARPTAGPGLGVAVTMLGVLIAVFKCVGMDAEPRMGTVGRRTDVASASVCSLSTCVDTCSSMTVPLQCEPSEGSR